MPRTGRLCKTVILIACVAAAGNLGAAEAAQPDIDLIVQGAAREVMRKYDLPGLAIALTADGRRRFYNFGVASRQTRAEVTSDTLFEIGSISKTFTATLATDAQARGRLALSGSPGKYLPRLRGSALDAVTLINLGTHTAGGFPLQLPDAVRTPEQLMDYFEAWRPSHAPGTRRSYANPGIGLLGVVVAERMEMPFEEAMEQHLLPALGLSATYINVPPGQLALYAQGYDKQDAPVRVRPGMLAAEAYGVKTSAKDLIRFVEANLNPAAEEAGLRRAILDTHIGYFRLGAMTQDLISEQYSYPVELDTLLEGNSAKVASESNAVTALEPPEPPREAVWINKTVGTSGFSAYVAFVPASRMGIVLLANKTYPVEARIRLAHRILTEVQRRASAATSTGK